MCVFCTTRSDPLNPTHTINGLTITDEPGMHPKGLPNAKNAPFYALTTHDIEVRKYTCSAKACKPQGVRCPLTPSLRHVCVYVWLL